MCRTVGSRGCGCVYERNASRENGMVVRGVISMAHLPGSVMVADLLTKAVTRPIFIALVLLLDSYSSDGIVCPVL